MSQKSSVAGEESSNSQASTMPSIYNTYLCREPANDAPMLLQNGPDEYTALLRTLQRSAHYFAERDHHRAMERLQLEMARLHMQYKQWERATRVLIPLWQTLSWRRAGWWDLLEEVDWLLRECVRSVQDAETLIAVDWELLNKSLTSRQDYNNDFSNVLMSMIPSESRPKAIIRAESVLSCISATFAFSTEEGNVGEVLSSQLTLSSLAHTMSTSIVISQIKVVFEGGLRNFGVKHDAANDPGESARPGQVDLYYVDLQRVSAEPLSIASSPNLTQSISMVGAVNLALAPGTTKALSFKHVPRDAGDVEVASITLYIEEKDFDVEIVVTEDEQMCQEILWVRHKTGLSQKILKSGRSRMVKILPKPPKLQIQLLDVMPAYFSNEKITITLLITNEEDDETVVTLNARLLGPAGLIPEMTWASDENTTGSAAESNNDDPLRRTESLLSSRPLGTMQRSEKRKLTIHIQANSNPAEYLLEIKADYHIASDSETPISKGCSTNIIIMQPFEASYNFLPLYCPEPWPSYFDSSYLIDGSHNGEDGGQTPCGLIQKWTLTSRIASLADVPLVVDNLELRVIEAHEGAVCSISPAAMNASKALLIPPHDLQEYSYTIKVQKLDLEDRRATFLDLQLDVRWHRDGSSAPLTTTCIAVPELFIPFGEPRVLAYAVNGENPPGVIHLDYIIENPSMYTLTFNLSMETSDEFAFSGAKNVSVQLVPLSRHKVRYNVMPLAKGVWISPQFRVYDTHFHKVLKVNTTEGMRNDKKGLSIWVDADG